MQQSPSVDPVPPELASAPRPSNRRRLLCHVPVDDLTLEQLVSEFVRLSHLSETAYVCYVNAHVHNLARADNRLREILQGAAICYADGMSIVWACRSLGYPIPQRMTGADFLPDVLERLHRHGRRVYLYGGRPGVAQACAAELAQRISGFQPVGVSHGFLNEDEDATVRDQIRRLRPDLLVVGLGTPRQERWMAEHAPELQVPLMWGVGALLDYFAGVEQRCPNWMARNGLEWAFRLRCQPRKMAQRYLLGNPRFVGAILWEHVRRRFRT